MRTHPGAVKAARRQGAKATAAALALAALLPGCAAWNDATYGVAAAIADTGGRIGAPWGTMTPGAPEATPTMTRVMAAAPPSSTLQVEAGNVWPGPAAPRATLANPDAALRGIPEHASTAGRGNTPALGDLPPPQALPPGPAARGLPAARRGSSTQPGLLDQPVPGGEAALPPRQALPPVPAIPPPLSRADGQVIQTPSGPVVTTGGTGQVQSFTTPGGGAGTAVRQGNNTLLIGPDGRVQSVPTAPR
jgi:hypothetical protein